MNTAILHLDLDTFFVSVERLKDPSLNGKPILVGGYSERSVVASCSYEARKFGVHAGMPIYKAKSLCPDALFVPCDMDAYSEYSAKVTQIIKAHVPVFEKASVDEFYCDLTGMEKYIGAWKVAQQLRQTILQQTQLPISMALANTKTTAKIGTGQAKPSGELWIKEGEERAFLAPLPIGKIPMAGEAMGDFLTKRGVKTIGELAAIPRQTLLKLLGKNGEALWLKANGIYHTSVTPYRDPKSISTETTFEHDISENGELLLSIMKGMAEKLCYRIRKQDFLCNCVTIKIRYHDFVTKTQQLHILLTNNDQTIIDVIKRLFHALYSPHCKVRLIGVRLSGLTHGNAQPDLFMNAERDNKLHQSVDKLRNRYGWKVIALADSKVNFR